MNITIASLSRDDNICSSLISCASPYVQPKWPKSAAESSCQDTPWWRL